MNIDHDVIVVGGGFAGMMLAWRLRKDGFSFQCFEAGGDVGGTWYWNRYPGVHCDVESLEYSYQFDQELQQDWNWSERMAHGPEILRYVDTVAKKHDIRKHFTFNTRVSAATFNEQNSTWEVSTDTGLKLTCRYFIMATGCLSHPLVPKYKGISEFKGRVLHTGRWPHEQVDFKDKKVAVIGTGSSGVHTIPIVAEQASKVYVFQRTANYVIPAGHRPIDPEYLKKVKSDYPLFRQLNSKKSPGFGAYAPQGLNKNIMECTEQEYNERFEFRWKRGGFGFLADFDDFFVDPNANRVAQEWICKKISEIVKDQDVARLLYPKHQIGCKRISLGTNYYETYNLPNVELVDVNTKPIEEMTESGIVIGGSERRDIDVDMVILATGFDAMTGAILALDIRGEGGGLLRDHWKNGPINYLGLTVDKFPNLFMVTGPGSPSVLTNMHVSIDHHVNYIVDCLCYLRQNSYSRISPNEDAVEKWVQRVNDIAAPTLYPTCASWYLGSNVPGKPKMFMPHIGFPGYAQKCAEVAKEGYEGFSLS